MIPEAEIQYPSSPSLQIVGIYAALASTLPSGSWDMTGQTAPIPALVRVPYFGVQAMRKSAASRLELKSESS